MQIQDLLQIGIPISADLVPTAGQGGVEFQTVFAEALAPPGDPPPPDGIEAIASEELKTNEPNAQSKKPDPASDTLQNPYLFTEGFVVNPVASLNTEIQEPQPIALTFSNPVAKEAAVSSGNLFDAPVANLETGSEVTEVIRDGKSWTEPISLPKIVHQQVSSEKVAAHSEALSNEGQLAVSTQQSGQQVAAAKLEVSEPQLESPAKADADQTLKANPIEDQPARIAASKEKATEKQADKPSTLTASDNESILLTNESTKSGLSQDSDTNPDSESYAEEFGDRNVKQARKETSDGETSLQHKEKLEASTLPSGDSTPNQQNPKSKEEVQQLREKIQDHQDRLAFNVRHGVSFVLESLELGKLDITIKQEGNDIQTTIATQDIAARQALYTAQPSLQQSFSDKGFNMSSFQLVDAQTDSNQQQAQREQAQSQSQFSGKNSLGTPNSFSPSKSISDGIDLWI